MQKVTFPSDGLFLYGVIDKPEGFAKAVLFLHGGGKSNTTRYEFLQEQIRRHKIASLAFDFRGCGQSQGRFEDGSLDNRLKDTEKALEFLKNETNLTDENIFVYGSSMGGHIACRLTETHPTLAGILLQSAAAYGKKAESVKLNAEFTNRIAKKNSWNDSQAFVALEQFQGKKLAVYGDLDTVIPDDIKHRYQKLVQPKNYVILKGAGHALLHPQKIAEYRALDSLATLTTKFISV